jgi:hypothetical protein
MYVVYDMMGKVVATRQNVNSANVVVSTEAFSTGIYMVEVTTAKGKAVQKITIN